MGFIKYLARNKYKPYKDKYINYEFLHSLIKEPHTEDDEKTFVNQLDNSIKDVFNFITCQYVELSNSIESMENLIANNKGSKRLSEILDEMSHFAEFIRINTEGFKDIIVKHDKSTEFELKDKYKKFFRQKLNQIDNLNKLIYRGSRLKLKTLRINTQREVVSVFIRKTRKYWVHIDNVYSLKLKIIKNLPLYVFNQNNSGTPYSSWDHRIHDTCVSSVYLDNTDFEQYLGRIHKNQGAEAFRIRWYGAKVTPIVFIERKRHEDNWTGYTSKKLRFQISESQVVNFLNGKNVWDHVKMLNGEESFELYKEIQSAIVTKNLRPVVRTFYKRSAFQLPNESTVRISLDSNLVMIRECPDDAFRNSNKPIEQWRRMDVECEWPFKNINRKDIVRFPHAILEVKTQGVDESRPEWIEEITSGVYVEHVHKYSKFMHGVAVLYRQVNQIPFWLPQMSTDIRKDPFHTIKAYKKLQNNEMVSVVTDSDEDIEDNGGSQRIGLPIRVEPKVFFANERTFLKWVQFSIFLGGIGTAILGMADDSGALCGSMMMLVSIMFIFYAFYIYKWRNDKIAIRFHGPYDDLVGPTVLVIVFMVSMILSIYFRYPYITD